MTYGYRLNVEQLLFKNANENWQKALEGFVKVSDSVPETGADIELLAPAFDDEESISYCIQAALGWAIATEAFVNLAWQSNSATSKVDEREFKGTVSKIKHLCKTTSIEYGALPWREGIAKLFRLRDYLVHYKDPITYVGFGFAAKFQRDFSKDKMESYQTAVISLFEVLGSNFCMDISFISGDFNLFYHSEKA